MRPRISTYAAALTLAGIVLVAGLFFFTQEPAASISNNFVGDAAAPALPSSTSATSTTQ